MADTVIPRSKLVIPRGVLRHSMLRDMGPGWLRMDGVTEYSRATYPDFLTAVAGEPNVGT